MAQPVLIVGAGPVGLTAAVTLRQHGIACRIIDKAPQRTEQSCAAIIHARTMEVLERLGVVEAFLAEGVRVRGGIIRGHDGVELVRFHLDDLPTPFPFFLGLTQSETERLLTEALSHSGVEIERAVELLTLTQNDVEVRAALRHADGREEQIVTPYLLGCDGTRSATRHSLGLTLEGETLDAQWLTADVRIDWSETGEYAIAYATADGFAFIARMDHDRWRIVANLTDLRLARPEDATLELVQDVCSRRLGIKARIYDPSWISPFAVNTRLAPTMNIGRVFLAGDAAHVHSPLGGQGMNTGMQDAFNLAWKVALAIKGQAGNGLLASYNAERHANARRLLSFVGRGTKFVDLHHPAAVAVRNTILWLGGHLGVGAIVARQASELEVHYRGSPAVGEQELGLASWLDAALHQQRHPNLLDCWDFGRGPRPGDRAPDAQDLTHQAGHSIRLFTDWVGDPRHQLLLFTGLQPKPERVQHLMELAGKVEAGAGNLIKVRLLRPKEVAAATGLVDADREAHHVYGRLRMPVSDPARRLRRLPVAAGGMGAACGVFVQDIW